MYFVQFVIYSRWPSFLGASALWYLWVERYHRHKPGHQVLSSYSTGCLWFYRAARSPKRSYMKKSCSRRDSNSVPLDCEATTVTVRPSDLIYFRQIKIHPGFICAIYSYMYTITRGRVFCRVLSIVVILHGFHFAVWPIYIYYSKSKMIQMLYDYHTEYTTKVKTLFHVLWCSTCKTW